MAAVGDLSTVQLESVINKVIEDYTPYTLQMWRVYGRNKRIVWRIWCAAKTTECQNSHNTSCAKHRNYYSYYSNRLLMRSTWRIENLVLLELNHIVAYTKRKIVSRLARER